MDTCLLALPRAAVPFLGPFRSSLGSFFTVIAGGLCMEDVFILSSSSLSVQDSLSKTFSVTGRIRGKKRNMSGLSHLEYYSTKRMRSLVHPDPPDTLIKEGVLICHQSFLPLGDQIQPQVASMWHLEITVSSWGSESILTLIPSLLCPISLFI